MRRALLASVSAIVLAAPGGVCWANSISLSQTSNSMPAIFPGSLATTYTLSSVTGSWTQSPTAGGSGSDLVNASSSGWGAVDISLSCSTSCWTTQTLSIGSTGAMTALTYYLSPAASITNLSTTTITSTTGVTFKYKSGTPPATGVISIVGGVFKANASPTTNVSASTTITYVSGGSSVLTTSAAVRSAISLTAGNQLKFGTIAIQGATAGTLVLGTNGTLTSTGGVDVVNAAANLGQAGTFSLKADSGASINVALPASVTLSSGATNTIVVSSFTTNPALPTSGTGSTATYSVGATLTVPSNQATGTYSGTFTVTASYN